MSFWKGTGELSLEASTSLAPGVSPAPRRAEEEEEEEEVEEEGEVAVEEAAGGVAVLEVMEVVRPAFCCSRRFWNTRWRRGQGQVEADQLLLGTAGVLEWSLNHGGRGSN